jgi:hypothetical protein
MMMGRLLAKSGKHVVGLSLLELLRVDWQHQHNVLPAREVLRVVFVMLRYARYLETYIRLGRDIQKSGNMSRAIGGLRGM